MPKIPRKRWQVKSDADPLRPVITASAQLTIEQFLDEQAVDVEARDDDDHG